MDGGHNSMTEHVIYIEETARWYREGATPLNVRVCAPGEKLLPLPSTEAATYAEAFEILYGHPMVIPPVMRSRPLHVEA